MKILNEPPSYLSQDACISIEPFRRWRDRRGKKFASIDLSSVEKRHLVDGLDKYNTFCSFWHSNVRFTCFSLGGFSELDVALYTACAICFLAALDDMVDITYGVLEPEILTRRRGRRCDGSSGLKELSRHFHFSLPVMCHKASRCVVCRAISAPFVFNRVLIHIR